MELNLDPKYDSIEIEILQSEVKSLVIKTDEDNIRASELLGKIDNKLTAVIGIRNGIIEEYEQRIIDTKSDYAPVIKWLNELKSQVKNEMLSYKERARLMINQIQDDIAAGNVEKYEIYVDESGHMINKTALSIRTPEGLSSPRKYYKFTVTDFSLLPDAFKIANKKLILDTIKKGTKDIPGVIIEEKDAIQYRGKAKAA